MNSGDKQRLLTQFLSQLNIAPNNTKRLFVVGMIGLVGSGKSYVAEQLAQATGLYIKSNDAIRRFLNSNNISGQNPDQELVQFIAEHTSDYLLANHISYIIDADIIKFYDVAHAKTTEHNAKLYMIEIKCSDKIIRQRIRSRSQKVAIDQSTNLSRADIAIYEQRVKIHAKTPKPKFDFVIDTTKNLTPQLQSIAVTMREDGVV